MKWPRQLLQIDFDQFQRYAAITVLLKPLLQAWQSAGVPVRILEVGSHTLNLLPAFLAPLSIEIVRADLEPAYAGEIGPYVTIRPDGLLPFADQAFTVVVAMEVLEHIPASGRLSAFREWNRVASHGVFLTCPNGESVTHYEQAADADFQARHGRVHPWLEEHERYGRPSQDEVMRYGEELGLTSQCFYNSSMAEWLPLLQITERLHEAGDRSVFEAFNERINSRPFLPFIHELAYRTIFACMKTAGLMEQAQAYWLSFTPPVVRKQREPSMDMTRLLVSHLLEMRNSQWYRSGEVSETLLSHRGRSRVMMDGESVTCETRDLIPLERQSSTVARWRVSGPNPSLTWKCNHVRGWHRLCLTASANTGQRARLQLDYGHGFNEQHVVEWGTWQQGQTCLSVNAYFHHPVRAMRLLPGVHQQLGILAVEAVEIAPISSVLVALSGITRVIQDVIRFPRITWQAMKQSPSLLHWAMLHTTTPAGLPFGAKSEHQKRMMLQRLEMKQSYEVQKNHYERVSFVVFIRVQNRDQQHHLLQTLRSLDVQHLPVTECWLACDAVQRTALQEQQEVAKLGDRLRWLPDGPDRGLAGLFNQCMATSTADWVMRLSPGTVLEHDAFDQLLKIAHAQPESAVILGQEGILSPYEGEAESDRQADMLGEAVAIHRLSCVQAGALHAAYEGALIEEYVHRVSQRGMKVTTIPRILLHTLPVSPSPTVSQVIQRIHSDWQEASYDVEVDRVTKVEADSWREPQRQNAHLAEVVSTGASS